MPGAGSKRKIWAPGDASGATGRKRTSDLGSTVFFASTVGRAEGALGVADGRRHASSRHAEPVMGFSATLKDDRR